jgi:hypothetical protein
VFEAQLATDPTAVVLDDVRIAWDVPELKPHGPDIVVDNELVCFNAAGQPLGDYQELAAALSAEVAARTAAEQRAVAAEIRLQALEAEVRRLRGETPSE